MKGERRKRIFMGNRFQKNLLVANYIAIIIPVALAISSLYFLVFKIIVLQSGISQEVLLNLISLVRRISFFLLIIAVLLLIIMGKIILRITHRIAGPLYRLEKELSERFIFDKKSPIVLRRKDELKSLVEKINKLLETKNK